MLNLKDVFTSVYIWTPVVGWLTAQLIKMLISLIRDRKITIGMIMSSGGMPSSHTATVVSATICIGMTQGGGSPLFAMMCILSFIVMYDATGVRRETGEQAKILNKLTTDLFRGSTKYVDRDLKELVGHTPIQVFAGAILGLLIGYVMPFVWGIWGLL